MLVCGSSHLISLVLKSVPFFGFRMTQREVDFGSLGTSSFKLKEWINHALTCGTPNEPAEVSVRGQELTTTEACPSPEPQATTDDV